MRQLFTHFFTIGDFPAHTILQRRSRKFELLYLAHFDAWFNCVNDNTRSHVQTKSDGNFLAETDFRYNFDDDPSNENDETDDTTEYQLKGGMKLVK